MITYRYAIKDDIPAILSLVRELADYEHMAHAVTATPALYEEWLFEKQIARVLLATDGDSAVGFALFFYNFSTWLGRAGIYLEDLYVKPEYRGRGIGKTLLKSLAKIAVDEGCGRLEWSCLDWNEPSIAFYRAQGAVSMDEWTTWRLTGETLHAFAQDQPKE